MRLFVAVDLPESVKEQLALLGKRLKTEAAEVSVAREHHLTLKFLGEQSADYAQQVERRLSAVAFKPFNAQLGPIGTFGEDKHIRVVWIGIEPAQPFADLAKQIDKATPEVVNDHPDYAPHITLCRVKRVRATEAFKEMLERLRPEPLTFSVREIKLYESVAGKEGHTYRVLRTFPAQPL